MVLIEHLWQGYRAETGRRWRRWGEVRWALRDVTLSVGDGELIGVIGANGSGKTTLLQCVAGVLAPLRGSVVASGRVTSLVDPDAGLHRNVTGNENMGIGGVLLGLTRAEIRSRKDEITAFTGLPPDALASPLREWTTGMWLRLGLALVLHSDPDVLVLDEGLAVVDVAFGDRCFDKITELRESGCAAIWVSHDLAGVARRAGRVAVLHHGEVFHVGQPDEAISRYEALLSADERG